MKQKREMVAVKICGITNWSDAKAAIDAGADALGFNFYAKSPRRISISHAREIIRHMPRNVSAVGIFVNSSIAEILKTARAAKLGVLQLHGEESPKTVRELARRFPVIKAFCVGPAFRVKDLEKYSSASAFLLDSFDERLRGGTGKTFNWRIVKKVQGIGPVILAGGLTKENAVNAIRAASPFAIDVCSGVERSHGRKDRKKLREFMVAVGRKRKKKE